MNVGAKMISKNLLIKYSKNKTLKEYKIEIKKYFDFDHDYIEEKFHKSHYQYHYDFDNIFNKEINSLDELKEKTVKLLNNFFEQNGHWYKLKKECILTNFEEETIVISTTIKRI